MEMKYINPNESDFVKDKRKNHCKGCLNENGYCTGVQVLDCWLRETYLPEGVYKQALSDDITWKCTNEISDEINKSILKDIYENKEKNNC